MQPGVHTPTTSLLTWSLCPTVWGPRVSVSVGPGRGSRCLNAQEAWDFKLQGGLQGAKLGALEHTYLSHSASYFLVGAADGRGEVLLQ